MDYISIMVLGSGQVVNPIILAEGSRKRERESEILLRGTIVNRTYGTHKNLPGTW